MSVEIIERESEQQWLDARRKFVTATDIGRLAHSGPAGWAAVKAEKFGAAGFRGNRYTAWGHEREPVILGHLEFLYGVTPNDSLYVNGTRAATPDGVGNGLLAEVKTTVRPWADLDALRHDKPNYYDQTQWGLGVAELDKAVFGFEPHENFIPGEVQSFEVPLDPKRLAELYEVEQRFIEYWQSEEQAGEWDEFMARYAVVDAIAKEAQAAVEAMKAEFREAAGDREIYAKTPFGSISYATPKPAVRFKMTAAEFEVAHPDLAAKFIERAPAKAQTLRITVK